MLKTNFKDSIKWFTDWCESWAEYKKEALESNDYDLYLYFLREVQITFTKLYAESKVREILELEETILKQVTHEISWVNNKKKEKEIPF